MEIKKKIERSTSYPRFSLEECVQNLIKIKKALGKGEHDRISFAKALEYKDICGIFTAKFSAILQFGLLVKKKDGKHAISENAYKITDPLTDDEKHKELVESFNRPKVFTDLLGEFSSDGYLPQNLETILHRKHNITEKAAKNAAKCFRESGIYARVLNEEGKILKKLNSESDAIEPEDNETDERSRTFVDPFMNFFGKPTEKEIGQHKYNFPLSEGMAYLQLPGKVSKKDIEIIKKHIEILELQVAEE